MSIAYSPWKQISASPICSLLVADVDFLAAADN